ncbi:MAG: protein-L-isoaspartate(D-aspartate) O-methyltransferase [Sphingomonadales bacterium]|nr:protein-L-isoaspartate(D-aspartate) O-methyltransferase [Sphingomonadales bacterium]
MPDSTPDSFRHQGLRQQLVEEVRKKGIRDVRVLAALGRVPRHAFLDNVFTELAYTDQAMPIGSGQTISQPYTVAFQTELLGVEERMKVLEVGTGSGYQACILEEMGARVFSIERQRALFHATRDRLKEMGRKIKVFFGDGTLGLPAFAPFDRILVTAGAPSVPEALLEQLKIGGWLVIPVGNEEIQKMMRIIRISESEVESETFEDFRFVPLLGQEGWRAIR